MKLASILLFVILVLALLVLGSPSTAEDPPATDEVAGGEEVPASEPLDTFVPSEKLPADSAIAFPVDI